MLYDFLNNIKGCKFAHVVLLTNVRIPKKLGLGEVTKRFEGEIQLNYSYENAVNNRLEKQGDERSFSSMPLQWGVWELDNKVILHKGERYMRYYLLKGNKAKVEYFVDGRVANENEIEIIKSYVNKSYSNRQAKDGLIENQVMPKAVKFTNILELCVGGERYTKFSFGEVG